MAAATAPGPLALFKGQKIQEWPRLVKEQSDKWLITQPPWVEALATGAFGSVQGAFLGGMMGWVSDLGAGQGAGPAARGARCQQPATRRPAASGAAAGEAPAPGWARAQPQPGRLPAECLPPLPRLAALRPQMTQMNANDPAAAAAAGPSAQLMKMGGPVQQARNFAVMTGVNAGMSALMKRVRGKEDIQGS